MKENLKIVEIIKADNDTYLDKQVYIMKHGEMGLIEAHYKVKELLNGREINVISKRRGLQLTGKDYYFVFIKEEI